DFSSLIADKNVLKMELLDISAIIQKCIASFSDNTPIQFENNLTNHSKILGHSVAIQTIFNNLIANAIKYNNSSAPIHIQLIKENLFIRTDITDHGIGIDKKDLPHIFEPFYRAADVRDAQIHGNGLGLSIVDRYVKLHGGSIRVASEPGKGSTFSVLLPEVM
ncbi:MAG TPA: ATP-binding protein, partial [bacterium]|nr:ATP-binding protein [bacterium]